MALAIRALQKQDDRSSFNSGDDELDRFLRRFAGQNQFRHHIGTTYVALDGDEIVGYATVASGSIEPVDVSAVIPRAPALYPLPILRLGRLAVSEGRQGMGIGSALLRFVFYLALQQRDLTGCVGVAVDAKRDAQLYYAKFGFTEVTRVIEGAARVPGTTVMFLPVGTIEKAVQG